MVTHLFGDIVASAEIQQLDDFDGSQAFSTVTQGLAKTLGRGDIAGQKYPLAGSNESSGIIR